MVWEFALPRSVFTSVALCSKTCVPYPTISLVCREALLVVKEFGSMAIACDKNKLDDAVWDDLPITNETDIYMRTWFSPELDTIMINPKELESLLYMGEAVRCDLLNSLRSPTTCLLVPDDCFHYRVYQEYLQNREKVLLSIGDVEFVLKDKAWDIGTAPRVLGTVGSGTHVIHLNDTAALGKYLELWEHCCQYETEFSWGNEYCDFEAWLKMAIDEGKREGDRGWMRRYTAWVVEDQVYEERLVSPEAYYVLRLADHILFAHGSKPNRHCGHEVVDYTGSLKKDHPLVQELEIKLPEVIPVCTFRIRSHCRLGGVLCSTFDLLRVR